jgi:uncharacterized protein YecT (DUF1311 family)
MRPMIVLCATIAVLATVAASAETAACPHADGDSCEEWEFERLDKELAELVAGPNDWIDGMPAHRRDDARAALAEAQMQWIKFRDAECRRELTWSYMTARTRRGFLANCLLNMTFRRRNDLQEAYKFKVR